MIKLNAGFSRKVGEANYGSRGASVNLELELDSGAIDTPEKLHDKIKTLFALARRAVDEELRNGNATAAKKDEPPRVPEKTEGPKAVVCAECGTDRISEKVVKYSTEKFGKPLCYRCQKKLNGEERR